MGKSKNKKQRRAERGGNAAAVSVIRQNPRQEWILFAIVACMVLYPPYFRGLFFHRAMFVTHILTALVFLGFWAVKKRTENRDPQLIRTPLDGAVLAFTLAYALSLITAVHFGEALYGFLIALNYFMLYWLVGQVASDRRGLEGMAHVLLLTALGVGLIGVLSASGYQVYPHAYERGMIHSTLQYLNSTAAFLGAISILGLALLILKPGRFRLLAYSLVVFILQVIVFSTISKGAWLTLALGGVVLVLGIPGWRRLRALYFLGGLGFIAFIAGNRFLPAITGSDPHQGVPVILAGMGLVAMLCLLWEAGGYIVRTKSYGKHIVAAAGIILLLAGGYALCSGSLGLSGSVLAEISGIGKTGSSSYLIRLDLVRWGTGIVKDYPIFGAGAGGWGALYHSYQDHLYWTTEVHNHFLQIWVETGTFGLLAFAGIWLTMFVSLFKVYTGSRGDNDRQAEKRDSQDYWILAWGCAAAALTMGMHASIDFDLSLPALSIILFTLMAMINSVYIMTGGGTGRSFSGKPAAAAAVLAGIFLLCMGSAALAAFEKHENGQAVSAQLEDGFSARETRQYLNYSVRQYEKAAGLFPWDGIYHADLAYTYAQQYNLAWEQGDQDLAGLKQKALRSINRAQQLSPGDMGVQNLLLNAAVLLGDFPLIMERLDDTTAANPLDVGNYNIRAELLWKAAEYLFKQGDTNQAAAYADAILLIPEQIAQEQTRIKPGQVSLKGEKLEITPTITLNMARVYYLQGRYQEAVRLLEPLYQASIKADPGEPEFIVEVRAAYAAALHRLGRTADAGKVAGSQAPPGVSDIYEDMIQWKVLP